MFVRYRLLRNAFSIVVLTGFCAGLIAQQGGQTSAEKDAQDKVMKLMREQIGVDGGKANAKNPKGLRVQFASIAQTDNPGMHEYRLLVPGAPEDQEYSLAGWKIGAGMKYSHEHVYVNAKGLVMLHKPTAAQENEVTLGKLDEVEVGVNAARGEPIRYMMASVDGKFFYTGTLVPFPLESRDGKCHLEARLGLPEGQTMLLYGDGLSANAKIPFITTSEGEEHSSVLNTDGEGRAVAILSPYVKGKDAGVVRMSVAMPGCKVSVEIPWGKGSYHPL